MTAPLGVRGHWSSWTKWLREKDHHGSGPGLLPSEGPVGAGHRASTGRTAGLGRLDSVVWRWVWVLNPEPAGNVSQGHWGRRQDRRPQGPAQGGGGSPTGGPPLGWVPMAQRWGAQEGSSCPPPMSGEPRQDESRCAGGQACLTPRGDLGTRGGYERHRGSGQHHTERVAL